MVNMFMINMVMFMICPLISTESPDINLNTTYHSESFSTGISIFLVNLLFWRKNSVLCNVLGSLLRTGKRRKKSKHTAYLIRNTLCSSVSEFVKTRQKKKEIGVDSLILLNLSPGWLSSYHLWRQWRYHLGTNIKVFHQYCQGSPHFWMPNMVSSNAPDWYLCNVSVSHFWWIVLLTLYIERDNHDLMDVITTFATIAWGQWKYPVYSPAVTTALCTLIMVFFIEIQFSWGAPHFCGCGSI